MPSLGICFFLFFPNSTTVQLQSVISFLLISMERFWPSLFPGWEPRDKPSLENVSSVLSVAKRLSQMSGFVWRGKRISYWSVNPWYTCTPNTAGALVLPSWKRHGRAGQSLEEASSYGPWFEMAFQLGTCSLEGAPEGWCGRGSFALEYHGREWAGTAGH